MARNTQNRYIQFYAAGSAARQLELPLQPQQQTPKPRRRKQKKLVLRVDLAAMAGIIVAAVMLLLMAEGAFELNALNKEVAYVERYIAQLEEEQLQLKNTYRESYDLEEIRTEALEMGLVPAEQAQNVVISSGYAEEVR